jgi:hypothetical protein
MDYQSHNIESQEYQVQFLTVIMKSVLILILNYPAVLWNAAEKR